MVKILGLIILIAGLGVGVYLVLNQTGFFSRADASLAPINMQISNISDNSISVSWLTNKPATGFIGYGVTDRLGSVVGDDRDGGGQKERLTHHVTLKNLDPNKTYYFKIVSGGKIFDSNGKPLSQKTAPVADNAPPVADPLIGKVTKKDGGVPNEALVYLKFGDNSLLSSYTRTKANWLITLNNARTADLKNYAIINPNNSAQLLVSAGADGFLDKTFKLGERGSVAKLALNPEKAIPTNTALTGESTNQQAKPATATGPNTPTTGVLDTANCDVISGWTCDANDYNASIDVHIYDGVAGVGTIVANGKADRERSDLKTAANTCNSTTAHGFEFSTPASLKDGKEHTIYAYGINIPASNEGNTQLWSGEVKKVVCSR